MRDKANEMIQNLKLKNNQMQRGNKNKEKFQKLMSINDSENVHVLIDYLDSVKKQESYRFKSSSCPISPKKSMPTIIKKVRMFTPEND